MMAIDNQTVYSAVETHYAQAAQNGDRGYSERVAKQFGYSAGELEGIPHDANLGLSCGNPHALANLSKHETVIDLGSGAGLDVFIAARSCKRAIGVDMNKEMLKKANQLLEKSGATNVSFIDSPITDIALPDQTADCIISNCVVNLVPETEKQLVFNECFRLLKPGGRFAISDILARAELPSNIKESMALYVGCIAGASQVADYERYLRTAGFEDILIVDTDSDLNIYTTAASSGDAGPCCPPSKSCCAPADKSKEIQTSGLIQPNGIADMDFNEFAGSFKIFAIKKAT